MNYPRYPEYKPSGVEWLGEVPAHWGSKRLKFATACINDKLDVLPEGLEYVALEHIESWTGKRLGAENGLMPESQTNRFQRGDVLFGKLRPYLAKVWLADRDGICSTELLVLRERDLEPAYLRYWTLMQSFVEIVDGSTYGSKMPRASWDFIGNVPALVPERDEQRAIAAFLDRETARIDALIAKKQRLIELLAEKRTALISQAVTKGLSPDAPMKDSGVEWLGEIPAHWDIKQLKFLTKGGLVNGLFKKKDEYGSGTLLVNVFDIYRDNFLVDPSALDRVEATKQEAESYAVLAGDIFFVRSSLKLEGVGKSACTLDVPAPMVFECHVVRARPDEQEIVPRFLNCYLNSKHALNRLVSLANMVTMATLDQGKIKGLEISRPPLEEQRQIASFIDQQIARTESVVQRIGGAIIALQEYRTSLISAAVTGKIDVRSFTKEREVA